MKTLEEIKKKFFEKFGMDSYPSEKIWRTFFEIEVVWQFIEEAIKEERKKGYVDGYSVAKEQYSKTYKVSGASTGITDDMWTGIQTCPSCGSSAFDVQGTVRTERGVNVECKSCRHHYYRRDIVSL